MSHLEMRYNEPLPHRPYLLPEGYRLVTVETDADKLGWIEACAEGLSTGAWTVKDFEKNMLEPEGLAKDQIFLVKDAAGRVVATATAWLKPGNRGYLHMVAALPEARGLGLGGLLTQHVLDFFLARGVDYITLDTDDLRLPAIKTYLRLGFIPVLSEYGAEQLWRDIFVKTGLRTPVFEVQHVKKEMN